DRSDGRGAAIPAGDVFRLGSSSAWAAGTTRRAVQVDRTSDDPVIATEWARQHVHAIHARSPLALRLCDLIALVRLGSRGDVADAERDKMGERAIDVAESVEVVPDDAVVDLVDLADVSALRLVSATGFDLVGGHGFLNPPLKVSYSARTSSGISSGSVSWCDCIRLM